MKLEELARRLGCELEDFDRHREVEVGSVSGIEEAGPGDLTFVSDRRVAGKIPACRATALLADRKLPLPPRETPLAILRCDRPDLAMVAAVRLLRPESLPRPGIHPTASIDPTARLGRDCHVGAYVVIGARCEIGDAAVIHPHAVFYEDVRAGDRLTVHAHAVIRERTRLGDDVILQPGVVLGGDGFGFARREDGSYEKVPQVGDVILADGVEVQANSCVDRATLASTVVGSGTKIDNLTQVAHNCRIGANVLLCAQVGVAGSTDIGDGAILAGQAGVAGHCRIGDGAIITAQSGTHGDLEGGRMYSGSPAFDHGDWLRSTAVFARLGELQREVRRLRELLRQQASRDSG